MSTPKLYAGLYRGVVTNVKDPEKRGRIKCKIADVFDTSESPWCEPCIPVAYDGGGDFCLPKVKETVWVAFEGGDFNFPIYIGNWWSENKTPLGSSYSDFKKTRVIEYDGMKVTMKDGTITVSVKDKDKVKVTKNSVKIIGDVEYDGMKVTMEEGTTTVSVDNTDKVKITRDSVKILGDVEITGTLKVNSINASSISTDSISTGSINTSSCNLRW